MHGHHDQDEWNQEGNNRISDEVQVTDGTSNEDLIGEIVPKQKKSGYTSTKSMQSLKLTKHATQHWSKD